MSEAGEKYLKERSGTYQLLLRARSSAAAEEREAEKDGNRAEQAFAARLETLCADALRAADQRATFLSLLVDTKAQAS